MKIKTDTEFISFSDGICDVYSLDEDGNKIDKHNGLGFSHRVLGFKRYYTAAANQVQVNNVISIPLVNGVGIHDTVEIVGMGKYDIELAQTLKDTNPPSIQLTLRQLEMFGVNQ